MIDFLPVILGTDWNAYGVASSFHMEYKIKSAILGMRSQLFTENLDYIDVHLFDNLDQSDVFLEKLTNFAKERPDQKLLLVSCSDYYTGLITENRDALAQYYSFNYVDLQTRNKLENKIDFYQICEEHGLPYPKTFIANKDNYRNFDLPFDFPVICKANDSFKWLKMDFEGYKKAYYIKTKDELYKVLRLVYENGYDDYMIIQDFIPGGSDVMYVVNAYVSQNGKVVMTHGAQAALDECLPKDIGNYNALISGDYTQLTNSVKEFLESIEYQGFANFDFKYDARDGLFKVFEINLRQGRSSMYMTYAGNNFVKYLVNDVIYNEEQPYYNHIKEHLWYLTDKHTLRKYAPDSLKETVNRLLDEKKANFGLDYASDSNLKRRILSFRRKFSTYRYYPKYMD